MFFLRGTSLLNPAPFLPFRESRDGLLFLLFLRMPPRKRSAVGRKGRDLVGERGGEEGRICLDLPQPTPRFRLIRYTGWGVTILAASHVNIFSAIEAVHNILHSNAIVLYYNLPRKSPDFLSNLSSFQFADCLCTYNFRRLRRRKVFIWSQGAGWIEGEKKLAALQLTPWENPEKTFSFSAQVGKKHFCSSAHLQMPTTTKRRGGRKEK